MYSPENRDEDKQLVQYFGNQRCVVIDLSSIDLKFQFILSMIHHILFMDELEMHVILSQRRLVIVNFHQNFLPEIRHWLNIFTFSPPCYWTNISVDYGIARLTIDSCENLLNKHWPNTRPNGRTQTIEANKRERESYTNANKLSYNFISLFSQTKFITVFTLPFIFAVSWENSNERRL